MKIRYTGPTCAQFTRDREYYVVYDHSITWDITSDLGKPWSAWKDSHNWEVVEEPKVDTKYVMRMGPSGKLFTLGRIYKVK